MPINDVIRHYLSGRFLPTVIEKYLRRSQQLLKPEETEGFIMVYNFYYTSSAISALYNAS